MYKQHNYYDAIKAKPGTERGNEVFRRGCFLEPVTFVP